VPEFHSRDAEGIPRAWVARIRASLAELTPRFSSNRMLAEYLQQLYLPAAQAHWQRLEGDLGLARDLARWYRDLRHHWQALHWGNVDVRTTDYGHEFRVQAYLGDVPPDAVSVQLYAEARPGEAHEVHAMTRDRPLSGAAGGFLWVAKVPSGRPARDYTPRMVPSHPAARVPAEAAFILWYPA
jgi:starch phosphorylase